MLRCGAIIYLCLLGNVGGAELACGALPPALWCKSEQVEKACGFADLCQRFRREAAQKPLQITVFFSSFDPPSQQLFLGPLAELYEQLSEIISIDMVPFGNSTLIVSRFPCNYIVLVKGETITCEHGPVECDANKLQSCVIKNLDDPFPFVQCLEREFSEGRTPNQGVELCSQLANLEGDRLNAIKRCRSSSEAIELQKAAFDKTASSWPEIRLGFAAFVALNGISTANIQSNLFDLRVAACDWYTDGGRDTPEICRNI